MKLQPGAEKKEEQSLLLKLLSSSSSSSSPADGDGDGDGIDPNEEIQILNGHGGLLLNDRLKNAIVSLKVGDKVTWFSSAKIMGLNLGPIVGKHISLYTSQYPQSSSLTFKTQIILALLYLHVWLVVFPLS